MISLELVARVQKSLHVVRIQESNQFDRRVAGGALVMTSPWA